MILGPLPGWIPSLAQRTSADPFTEGWAEMASHLEDAPKLENKRLLEDLLKRSRPLPVGVVAEVQRRAQQWWVQGDPTQEGFSAAQVWSWPKEMVPFLSTPRRTRIGASPPMPAPFG